MNTEQHEKIKLKPGFIAALDQSGGSTPKALAAYGVLPEAYGSDEAKMFAIMHDMRARIIKAPAFTGEKIIGAILFERTMDSDIEGTPTAHYLWQELGVVPFLKVDKGLADAKDGVQLMKPMPALDGLLKKARDKGIYGTKMRSVISAANKAGIGDVTAQQFEIARAILDGGLMPIVEPEISIDMTDKTAAEALLRDEILGQLEKLPNDKQVMLKLTLPESPNFYQCLVEHPKVLRVVALSGGYDRAAANARLAQNSGVIASFSRALTEGVSAKQSDADFNARLGKAIDEIYAASTAG